MKDIHLTLFGIAIGWFMLFMGVHFHVRKILPLLTKNQKRLVILLIVCAFISPFFKLSQLYLFLPRFIRWYSYDYFTIFNSGVIIGFFVKLPQGDTLGRFLNRMIYIQVFAFLKLCESCLYEYWQFTHDRGDWGDIFSYFSGFITIVIICRLIKLSDFLFYSINCHHGLIKLVAIFSL